MQNQFTFLPVHLPTCPLVRLSASLLQQLVNILNIIQRIIQEKLQFRHDTQLVVNTQCQEMTDFTAVMAYFIKQDLLVGDNEQAQMYPGYGEVFAYLDLGHGNQGAFKQIPALLLENDAQILLNQA